MGTTFKFKITLVDGMRVTTFRINEARLNRHEIDELRSPNNPNLIEGQVSPTLITDKIDISVYGVGTQPNLAGTFNISLDSKKLFSEDQMLIVRKKGRFRFFKPKFKISL